MPVNPRRLLPPLLLLAASACSSSSTSPGGATDGGSTPPPGYGGGGTDGASSGADSASPPAGYTLTLAGMNYAGTGIAIAPQMSAGGVYQGYYVAESDQGASPSLSVSIKAPSATLAAGTSYACDRSSAGDGVETSVLVHWLDGHTYSTNVLPNPT